MESRGFIIYGYSREAAEKIRTAFEKAAEAPVIMINASKSEEKKIDELLDGEVSDVFEERETGFVMFLGFDRELVSEALKVFPEEIKRPIFCGLTETNSTWTVAYLIEHLVEEKAYWEKRKK